MDNQFYEYDEKPQETGENIYGTYTAFEEEARKPEGSSFEPPKRKGGGILKMIALMTVFALLIGLSAGGGVYLGHRLSTARREVTVAERGALKEEEEAAKADVAREMQKRLSIQTMESVKTEVIAGVSDVSAVVENVMPSIVSITNMYEVTARDLWGRVSTSPFGGSGSGIIIGQNNDEILIVTNNHVIAKKRRAEEQKITVTFADENTAEAVVKGADSGSDLAVISVKMEDLSDETLSKIKIASLGDSSKAKVGQMVIAIGNALGYGQSTTVGYISALNREIPNEDYTMKLIQTDAAINEGNSGGALLNAKGEVIGINSIKYAGARIEGMGFAIPISSALPIINDLMNREIVSEDEQSYLGIVGQDVTEAHHKSYGMPVGIYVSKVSEKSPAAEAGLRMGDIITEFNRYPVKTMKDLQERLASIKAGKRVDITLMQYDNGTYKEKKTEVVLGRRADIEGKKSKRENRGEAESRRFLPEEEDENDFFGEEKSPFDFFFNP